MDDVGKHAIHGYRLHPGIYHQRVSAQPLRARTVTATFAGSKAYWPSHANTAFVVDEAFSAVTPEPTQAPASLADQYLLPATGGIIAAIAIVGVVLALLLRER